MTQKVLLLTFHLIGVGTLVGVVFASVYYVLKLKTVEQLKDFITLRRIGAAGATLAILSGLVMSYRWLGNLIYEVAFMSKMGLILLDGIIAEFVFVKVLKKARAENSTESIKNKLLPWAIVSVLIVVAIITISAYRDKLH